MTFSQWRHFFKANHHQRKVLREGIRLARTRARENKCYEKKICRKRCRSSQIYGYPMKFRVMTYIIQSFTVLKIGFDLHLTTKMRNIRRNWWQNM